MKHPVQRNRLPEDPDRPPFKICKQLVLYVANCLQLTQGGGVGWGGGCFFTKNAFGLALAEGLDLGLGRLGVALNLGRAVAEAVSICFGTAFLQRS